MRNSEDEGNGSLSKEEEMYKVWRRPCGWTACLQVRRCFSSLVNVERVRVVEVGPRDGLQNESKFVPTERKVKLVEDLVDAGIGNVEVTSFVSPQWVPQLSDSAEVFSSVKKKPGVNYTALVPNARGFETAKEVNARQIAVFAAASETFSKKNLNLSVSESLEKYRSICADALENGMKIRGYVSTVVRCPYEGDIKPGRVADVVVSLLDMGCFEVSLGDTIGAATPGEVENLLKVVTERVPISKLAVHFHDTCGTALANVLVALQAGVHSVDSSVGGEYKLVLANWQRGSIHTRGLHHAGCPATDGIAVSRC
uniref:hydroxymethylglutaryl-CoA lyase n=1 Tax=Rhodosorus marinus TaxID=101924 RepID=A0A7S3A2Y9_9RHOD|mmetsp:Transcript_40370/g.160309  ORF Transcript_40370/g.160309 Transcript_40370/m.160309 type:complete len:312 (+) Transcript_40370:539-1474(+)